MELKCLRCSADRAGKVRVTAGLVASGLIDLRDQNTLERQRNGLNHNHVLPCYSGN